MPWFKQREHVQVSNWDGAGKIRPVGLGKLYCIAHFRQGRRIPLVHLEFVYVAVLIHYNFGNNNNMKLICANSAHSSKQRVAERA